MALQNASSGGARPAQSAIAVPRPLYLQVRELLISRIDQGVLGMGDMLPNEFLLSTEFGVSIGTIRKAIDHLEELGLVARRQGRGTYVIGNRQSKIAEKFNPLRLPTGENPQLSFRLDSVVRRRPSRDEAQKLRIDLRQEIFVVAQAVLSKKEPIGAEVSCLDARLIPHIESTLTAGRDLALLLAETGHVPSHADDIVSFCAPTPVHAAAVGANGSAHVGDAAPGTKWFLTRLTRGATSAPIELKTGCYDAHRVCYAGFL